MEDILVPIFAIIFTFGAPALVLWLIIASKHKERLTIIERGLDPAQYKVLYDRNRTAGTPANALKWSLLLVFLGAGLWFGSWLVQVYHFPDSTIPAVTMLGAGVGLGLYYLVASKKTRE